MDKQCFSISESAKLLEISKVDILNKIKSGEIKARKLGQNYIIFRHDNPKLCFGGSVDFDKKLIKQAVKRVVKEYGGVLRMLGKE